MMKGIDSSGEASDPERLHFSAAPAVVRTKLVDTVFDQGSTIVIGSVNTVGIALFCYARSGQTWLLGWAFVSIALLGLRLYIARAYRRRHAADDPNLWGNRFTAGAALAGLAWGIAGAISILHSDIFEQMTILSAESGYVAAGAVRNNGVLRAALAQTMLPLGVTILACFATENKDYIIFSLFIFIYLTGTVEIARFLNKKTTELLIAQEVATRAVGALTAANLQLEALATTDGLTCVVNRRGFDVGLAGECTRAAREKQDLSLIIADIDHFKSLNDTLGHQAGDECLQRLAVCLLETIQRQDGMVARYGGEEFAILLPKTDLNRAALIAENIRVAVQTLSVSHAASPFHVVTVSVGYATLGGTSTLDSAALVRMADAALYRAKAAGRNCIEGSGSADVGETRGLSAMVA